MPRPGLACALLTTALVAAVPVPASAQSSETGPQAGAARGCSIRGQQDNLGATYVTTLRVSGTTCSNGKKVVRAYHRCRRANGGADGRCRSRVFGYKCSERRLNVLRNVSYDARVRCTKSGREIFHRYQQNT